MALVGPQDSRPRRRRAASQPRTKASFLTFPQYAAAACLQAAVALALALPQVTAPSFASSLTASQSDTSPTVSATPFAVSAVAMPSTTSSGEDNRVTKIVSVVVPIVSMGLLVMGIWIYAYWKMGPGAVRMRRRLGMGMGGDERPVRLPVAEAVSGEDAAAATTETQAPRRARRGRAAAAAAGLRRTESGRSIRTLPAYTKEAGDAEVTLLRYAADSDGDGADPRRDPSIASASTADHRERERERPPTPGPAHPLPTLSEDAEGEHDLSTPPVAVSEAPSSWGAAPPYDIPPPPSPVMTQITSSSAYVTAPSTPVVSRPTSPYRPGLLRHTHTPASTTTRSFSTPMPADDAANQDATDDANLLLMATPSSRRWSRLQRLIPRPASTREPPPNYDSNARRRSL